MSEGEKLACFFYQSLLYHEVGAEVDTLFDDVAVALESDLDDAEGAWALALPYNLAIGLSGGEDDLQCALQADGVLMVYLGIVFGVELLQLLLEGLDALLLELLL